jgi:hypothetical protein
VAKADKGKNIVIKTYYVYPKQLHALIKRPNLTISETDIMSESEI